MSYLMNLRKFVGSTPLIACGAAVAIVNHENKLLLQQRADNHCWALIGGTMEIGESIEETAKREVLEEVGIKLSNLSFSKLYSGKDFYYKYPNGDEVYNVVSLFMYKGYITDSMINIDEKEVVKTRFFSFDEIPVNLSPPDVLIIKDVIDNYR